MNTTQQTLDLIKQAQLNPAADALAKAFTQATGLVSYDLQAPAIALYPWMADLTPLRNSISRVSGNGDTATRWKAITGINTGNLSAGVSEGNRGGTIATSTASYTAAYKGIGFEDNVSFEADYAATGFDDVKARSVEGLLRSLMLAEERILLGGNSSIALGTTPTPTLAASTTGGSLATQTLSVICVALTPEGQYRSSVAGGVVGSVTRTNADASSDTYGGGSAMKSNAATVSVTGATGSATGTVAVVNGASAYAWYWGVGGSELLGAITTINSVAITANATGTQNASAITADNSENALVFDGLLTQICGAGSNAYIATQATGTPGTGTPLTSDGAGGTVEFETAFLSFYNNYKLSPQIIYMSATDLVNMTKKIIANGGAPLFRFNMDNGGGSISAGAVVGSYLNKVTNSLVKVAVHPNMPQGTILFYSTSIPYSLSGVANVVQVKTRREYYQLEWPLKSRKYEYGVYADELLQNYFPPAFGIIRNVANG